MSETQFDLTKRPDLTGPLDEALNHRNEESYQTEFNNALRMIAVAAFEEQIQAYRIIEEISKYITGSTYLSGEVTQSITPIILRVKSEIRTLGEPKEVVTARVLEQLSAGMLPSLQAAFNALAASGVYSITEIDQILRDGFEKAYDDISTRG
jgi:hypothetical protein